MKAQHLVHRRIQCRELLRRVRLAELLEERLAAHDGDSEQERSRDEGEAHFSSLDKGVKVPMESTVRSREYELVAKIEARRTECQLSGCSTTLLRKHILD